MSWLNYTCAKGTRPLQEWLSVYVGALRYGSGHQGSICKDSKTSPDVQRLKTIMALSVYCAIHAVLLICPEVVRFVILFSETLSFIIT